MSTERIRLDVSSRGADQLGSVRVRRLRRDGLIPGVLYGKGAARAIAVGERDLRAALTGPSGLHTILDVVIDGQKTTHPSVLKDYQQHPVRGTLTHIDLHEVRLDQPIQTAVSVQLVGDAPGVRMGGVLTQVTRELNVEALPGATPEHLEFDVSELELGDTLRLADVDPVDGITFLDDPNETVLATVAAPRGLEVEEAEEGEAAEEGAAPEATAEAADASPDEE